MTFPRETTVQMSSHQALPVNTTGSGGDFLTRSFIEASSPKLYNMLRSRYFRRSHEMAEDVLQQTWLNVFRAKDKFRGDSEPYSWVYKIATNLAFNELKKQKNTPCHETEEDEDALDTRVSSNDPLDLLIAEETAEAIHRISEDKFVSIALEFASEDTSYEELAGRHNIAVGTAKSRIFRGRQMLLDIV